MRARVSDTSVKRPSSTETGREREREREGGTSGEALTTQRHEYGFTNEELDQLLSAK